MQSGTANAGAIMSTSRKGPAGRRPKARILCRIDREDRHLMLNWTIQLARRGLPLRKIRRACEGKKAPWKP
jgi:hypothetical protein